MKEKFKELWKKFGIHDGFDALTAIIALILLVVIVVAASNQSHANGSESVEAVVYDEPLNLPEPIVEEPEPVLYFDVPLSTDLQDHIFAECEKYGVDPALVMAMIKSESTFKASVVSSRGAQGLMQIIPKWHTARMASLGCSNLFDPYQNVTVGINYISELIGYGRSVEWALMVYNGGFAYANSNYADGVISSYARKILADKEKFNRVTEVEL